MAECMANLRLLLGKDVLFQWTESHEVNFQKLKDSISSDACLMYFNSSKPVILQVGASKLGTGGMSLTVKQPWKAETSSICIQEPYPAETRYANMEREMLAVVWGFIKFHHYLYGRKFVCHTDNKCLEDIHLKYLNDAPARPQRLLLKLQPYDINIKYVPGFQVPVADALNRDSPSGRTEIKGLDVTIHEIIPDLSHVQVETIQQATKEDPTLQLLMQQLMEGWPEHVNQVPKDLKPFWQLRDDLSIEYRCVLFQHRFYIPQALRSSCLKTLH